MSKRVSPGTLIVEHSMADTVIQFLIICSDSITNEDPYNDPNTYIVRVFSSHHGMGVRQFSDDEKGFNNPYSGKNRGFTWFEVLSE